MHPCSLIHATCLPALCLPALCYLPSLLPATQLVLISTLDLSSSSRLLCPPASASCVCAPASTYTRLLVLVRPLSCHFCICPSSHSCLCFPAPLLTRRRAWHLVARHRRHGHLRSQRSSHGTQGHAARAAARRARRGSDPRAGAALLLVLHPPAHALCVLRASRAQHGAL